MFPLEEIFFDDWVYDGIYLFGVLRIGKEILAEDGFVQRAVWQIYMVANEGAKGLSNVRVGIVQTFGFVVAIVNGDSHNLQAM